MIDGLSKRAARHIIRGLRQGTIESGGAKYLHCGQENWLRAQLEELSELEEDGGAVIHFVRGAYGEGKTHFLNHLQELARDRGWATSHLECRHEKIELDHTESLYTNIVRKLRLFPDVLENEEEALEDPARKLLDLWASKLLEEVGFRTRYVRKPLDAEAKLFELLQERVMKKNLPGDFQRAICAYPRAVVCEDYTCQNDLAGWIKGETRKVNIPSHLLSKPGQRVNAPGVDHRLVGAITIAAITSSMSLDVLRGIVWILRFCGFKGLVIAIDEVEQIARLRPQVRRERALQALREFVDNTDEEIGLQNIAVYFAATPNMFDDEAYFRSYDALATRIEPIGEDLNWRSPVINLEKTKLSDEQLEWVAKRIRTIYDQAQGVGASRGLGDDSLTHIVTAVSASKYRVAKPRLLCRSIVNELESTHQGHATRDPEGLIAETAAKLLAEETEE